MKHLLHKIKHLGAPLALITLLLLPGLGWGQVNISAGNTVTQDFSIGTSATATLPAGWKADKNTTARSVGSYASAVTATEQRAGNNMSSSAGNGIYNYAAGDPTSATDRAVGGLSSSSSSKSVNVYVQLFNNGSTEISNFTISYNVEKYRKGSNAAGFSIQMYYSTNGTTWTSAGNDFLTSFSADADNNGYASAPGSTVSVSSKTLSQSLAASSSLYLAWNYSVTSGTTTSNAQALGIDDVSITANGVTGNNPPSVTNIVQTPTSGITSNITVSVSADVTDSDGTVEGVELHWGTSSGNLINNIDMSLVSGNTYTTDSDIPAQAAGTTVYYQVYAIDDDADDATSAEQSYYVVYGEPTNHVTSFSAASPNSSTITVTWNDNNGDQPASGFLILANKTGTFTDPVDGTPQTDDEALADGTGVKNISSGVGSYSWVNLDASTQYFFRIYPYTNSGSAINYKTDGTVPEDDATTMAPSIVTYTWAGADNASWAVSANWSPVRSAPANTDVLVFNDGTTKTITAVPNQTIGQLFVTNNTIVTLQPAATGTTLSINGGTGDDLAIEAGSGLNISGSNTLVIALGTSATGSVSGTMTFAGGAHKLTSLASSGITFNNGSVFTAGTSFSGNAFNNLTANSVIFSSGSTYIYQAGSNPFGLGQPASVVVFQTGSLYKHQSSNSPALSGRNYADFEYDFDGTASVTATAITSIDNLTVSQGVINVNVTTNIGHSIRGNISVQSGATLSFNPASAGTINLNGNAQQTVSGNGSITSNGNSTLVIDNASGLVLDNNMSLTGNLTIASGSLTINPAKQLTVSGFFSNQAGASSLVLKSDASASASLIHSTGNVPATVERYISGHNNVADAGWHLLGSPVAAFDIDGSSFDPGASDDFYAWQESNSTWMNHKQGTPSQIVPGTGYLVSYETSGTKTFTGALNAADQTVTVTREGAGDYAGFNLIGNPFASAITWGTGWSLGSVGGVAYVWDEATKDYIDIEAGGPIPSANGVMVYLGGEETSQSLTIPAAARIHSSQGWYKSAGGRIVLVANDPDRGAAKRSVIRFNESATEGFDLAWDGYYLRGFAPGFYSVSNGMNYSVNTLPSMNNTLVIPMGFEKTVSSGFSIELQESIPGAVVYLTDKKTGTVTNLTDNGAYHFTAAEGDDANRFTLHFGTLGMDDPSTAAPVHIYAYGGVVYLNGLDAKASVTITDLTGRVVMAERVNGNGLAMLNAGSLPKGVYVVTAVAGSQVVSAKVIL